MRKILVVVTVALCIVGCEKESSPNESHNNITTSGSLGLYFDKSSTPEGVATITATLSREGYDPIAKTLNLLSDSTAEILIENVSIGTWKLKVDAADASNKILYTGQTNITVVSDEVTQVNLVLQPVASGVGSIQINVIWGTTDNGLVLYYPLDGNANDASGHGYHGIASNITTAKNRFGVGSAAMSFNGFNSIIRCGDILDEVFSAPIAKFTVSAWAKPKTTYGNPLVCKSAGGVGPYQWALAVHEGVGKAEVYSDTVAANYVQIGQSVAANQWSHLVLVFDGSLPQGDRMKFFVNGQSDSAFVFKQKGTLGVTTINCSHPVTVGAIYDTFNPQVLPWSFNGEIDEVRIYKRALTQAEIQALYAAQN